jgi:hypothetical protein
MLVNHGGTLAYGTKKYHEHNAAMKPNSVISAGLVQFGARLKS